MIQFLIGINSNVYVRFLCLIFTQPLLIQRAITSGQIRYNQMALVLALRSFKWAETRQGSENCKLLKSVECVRAAAAVYSYIAMPARQDTVVITSREPCQKVTLPHSWSSLLSF